MDKKIEIFDEGIRSQNTRLSLPLDTRKPPAVEVEACKEWLQRYASKPQSKNKHGAKFSYGLKHLVEKVCKPDYISNGALIQAAVDMGYEWFRVGARSPNVYFYMNLELPRAYRDGKRPVEGVPIIVMDHNARMLSE